MYSANARACSARGANLSPPRCGCRKRWRRKRWRYAEEREGVIGGERRQRRRRRRRWRWRWTRRRWRRSHVAGTLRAYRDPEFCLAYARTNPSICASFLPRMATTSFQGRSRRLPLAPLQPVTPPSSFHLVLPRCRGFFARAEFRPERWWEEAGARSIGIRDRRSRWLYVYRRLGGLGSFNSANDLMSDAWRRRRRRWRRKERVAISWSVTSSITIGRFVPITSPCFYHFGSRASCWRSLKWRNHHFFFFFF